MVVDEQLDQWQSTASELKCGRLCMLADWSLALQSGPTPSASSMPKDPVPLSLLGPHISIRHQWHPPSDSTMTLCPQAGHSMITSTMSNDGGETIRAWNLASLQVLGLCHLRHYWLWHAEVSEHGPCDVIDMICKCSKAPLATDIFVPSQSQVPGRVTVTLISLLSG